MIKPFVDSAESCRAVSIEARRRKNLKGFGGILFSPPNKKSTVKKFHICVNCYREIEKELR